MARLVLTALEHFPLVRPGDDLPALIVGALRQNRLAPEDGDVLVVAHKVISKAEGRLVKLDEVEPSEEARRLAAETGKDPRLVEVVLRESRAIVRTRPGVIVAEHHLGWVCANAAVDRSNAPPDEGGGEQLVLLPRDPDASARAIRDAVRRAFRADVAVIVNDTHGRPFRLGAVGVAVGVAGMAPLTDLRGRRDLFGYTMRTTEVATADELAAAASLLQGQGDEGRPVVHVRGAPFVRDEEATSRRLIRPRELDMFRG